MKKTYRDSDGNVWEPVNRDTYRHVAVGTTKRAWEFDYSDRLTEINPYCDETTSNAIHAELSILFGEMADEVWSPYSYSGVDDDIRSVVSTIFEGKSRALRERLGMED